MRKLLVSAGLAVALVALPVGSAVSAAPGHAFKGKGSGSLTRTGNQFVIDGTITIKSVGSAAFHTTGTSGNSSVSFTTTFTAPNGDTLTTASTGTARHTKRGKVFVTSDTISVGTGLFATAAGKGKTAAKVRFPTPDASTGTVKFVVGGKIRF